MNPLEGSLRELAGQLWSASSSRIPCEPVRTACVRLEVALTDENAYTVQRLNRARRLQRGDACVGRNVGLASANVQREQTRMGEPLQASDTVLTGPLGPMVAVRHGDVFEVDIDGLGSVGVAFE
jgi:2-keto-4-pentenoate hydratase